MFALLDKILVKLKNFNVEKLSLLFKQNLILR